MVFALNSRLSQNLAKEFEKAWYAQAFFLLFVCLAFTGCTSLVSQRIKNAQEYSSQHNMAVSTIETGTFQIFAAYRSGAVRSDKTFNRNKLGFVNQVNKLHIVIEGDGYAWCSENRLSRDPTPKSPVGLYLANSIKGSVLYLGRPCQYGSVEKVGCHPKYWSTHRYGDEVIASYMHIFDQVKNQHNVDQFEITGFSGGAYLALVLASLRDDVVRVSTVAGLLDVDAWTDYHAISRMYVPYASLQILQKSIRTDFVHFCSEDDDVIPCRLTRDFVGKAESLGAYNHEIKAYEGYSHHNLWQVYE